MSVTGMTSTCNVVCRHFSRTAAPVFTQGNEAALFRKSRSPWELAFMAAIACLTACGIGGSAFNTQQLRDSKCNKKILLQKFQDMKKH